MHHFIVLVCVGFAAETCQFTSDVVAADEEEEGAPPINRLTVHKIWAPPIRSTIRPGEGSDSGMCPHVVDDISLPQRGGGGRCTPPW